MQRITKLEAARRQIDCAIRRYLYEDDILAVQTLSWAGLSILMDYDKATNHGSSWTKAMRGYPGKLNREISNFLKHADRDPHGELFDKERRNPPEKPGVPTISSGGRDLTRDPKQKRPAQKTPGAINL